VVTNPTPLVDIEYAIILRGKVVEQRPTHIEFTPAAGRAFVHDSGDSGFAKGVDFLW
jgi:hypothetical protein